MFLNAAFKVTKKYKVFSCGNSRIAVVQSRFLNLKLEDKYTNTQKEKILQVVNESDSDTLSRYDITKGRLKKFSLWKDSNGQMKNLSDLELIDGFSHKTAAKLFDSILEGPLEKTEKRPSKIKGQILQPSLSESVRQVIKKNKAFY